MAKTPTPPTVKSDLPDNHVKVKHKINGKEFIVSKAYLDKHSDTLEAV